jgi:hypothetical protein
MINITETFIAALKKSPRKNSRPGSTGTLTVGIPYNEKINGADAVSLCSGQCAPPLIPKAWSSLRAVGPTGRKLGQDSLLQER